MVVTTGLLRPSEVSVFLLLLPIVPPTHSLFLLQLCNLVRFPRDFSADIRPPPEPERRTPNTIGNTAAPPNQGRTRIDNLHSAFPRNQRYQSMESSPETHLSRMRPPVQSNTSTQPAATGSAVPARAATPAPFIKPEPADDDSPAARQDNGGDGGDDSGAGGSSDAEEELRAQLALAEATANAA